MNFIFQTVFTRLSPTNDQTKAIFQDFCRKIEEDDTKLGRLQKKDVERQTEILRLRQEKDKYQIENCKLRQENDAKAEELVELKRKYSELKSLEEQKNSCSLCLENLPSYSEWSSQLELQGSRHSSRLYDLGLELGLKPEKSGFEIGKNLVTFADSIWDDDRDTFADSICDQDGDTFVDSIWDKDWNTFADPLA